MNFWNELKKPILCLAPMADVTDAAFRFIISKYSNIEHITYTEFVSADGLAKAPEKGRQKLLKDLEYSETERPIVAQFFTSNPDHMRAAAELAAELGFDGVDINMGCPDKSVEKQGAGAALIKNPKLAREIIAAAKEAGIPISVKTRLGYNRDELEEWLQELLAEEPAAVIIHARTRKEMSKTRARWERIKDAAEIRNEMGSRALIIGNGDVRGVSDALEKCEQAGADGAMLGRAVFGNPWLFSDHVPTTEEKIKVLTEHMILFDQKFKGLKSFAVMKKHFKAYLSGIVSKEFMNKPMQAEDAKEALEMLYSEKCK